jgi:hypothetical protein
MKQKLRTSIVAACVLAVAACADQQSPVAPEPTDPLLEFIVAMGFDRDQIVDTGNHFVVEGDMRFSKAQIRERLAAGGAGHPAGGPSLQRLHSGGAATQTAVQQIRVNLSAVDAENASWASATRQAMANWNNLPGTAVTFVEGTPAHITVRVLEAPDIASCVPARGDAPLTGVVGDSVTINRAHFAAYSYAKQVLIMTHEFGHNIGLAHTNSTDGTHISGTPTTDPGSVMNAPSSGCPPPAPDWAGFSAGDEIAAIYLYPDRAAATVSNVGGYPRVNWPALHGASSYTVTRIVDRAVEDAERGNSSETIQTVIGTVTTPGVTDFGVQYTGYSSCTWSGYPVSEYEAYSYKVTAQFPNGTTVRVIEAPIGSC